MCGRYRLSRRKQLVEEYFERGGEDDWVPRYNVAPIQPVPIIRQSAKEPVRELSLVRWGLIPWWAKDSSGAAAMINARSETVATKPAFRDALKLRRFWFRQTASTNGRKQARPSSRDALR
jgi:putative SOS response-associated peptidase YedK